MTGRASHSIYLVIGALLFILLSGSIRSGAVAQERDDSGRDWSHVNFDGLGTNFNPQTIVKGDNIESLEIKWVFPIPEPQDPNLGGYTVSGKREISTPLIVNGSVYFATSAGRVYALDGENGSPIWVHTLALDRENDESKELPIHFGPAMTHVHGITYFEGKLFVPSPPCDIYIIDSDDGQFSDRIGNMCDVGPEEGNAGRYKGPQSYGPTIYEKERVIVVAGGAVDETNRGGRGFFAGYDLDSKELLWRFFVAPPAGGDAEWGLRYADIGWIRGIRASSLPRESLLNDWGDAGSLGSQASPNRGQWTIDEETGIIYVGTTHAAPASNATNRPGPNLFAASVLALDAETGNLIWWHQIVPHDLSDWDCNWNIVLGRAQIDGIDRKVVFKGCKDGAMNAFSAENGALLWSHHPETVKICEACHLLDPTDPEDLKKRWANFPEDDPFFRNPSGRGGLVSDIAVAYDRIYYGTYNFWEYVRAVPVSKDRPNSEGGVRLDPPEFRPTNTTIYALDASTGEVSWTYFLDNSGYRTSIVATGGMVIFTSVDGNIRALSSDTGEEIWKRYFGTGLLMPPSIGADSAGDIIIVQAYGGQISQSLLQVSSAIIALGLPTGLALDHQGNAEPFRLKVNPAVSTRIEFPWIGSVLN